MKPVLPVDIDKIFIQSLFTKKEKEQHGLTIDVLRLDVMHPVISGNKYFKLVPWLEQAVRQQATHIGTFGGAYSNHLVATANACHHLQIPFTGIIRGEEPASLSPALQDAVSYGMKMVFVSRSTYRDKEKIRQQFPAIFWIDEGGYGQPGAAGAAGMLACVPDAAHYTHIICAVGTGTMMAGLLNAAAPTQEVIGISVMKNNFSLENNIRQLLAPVLQHRKINLIHSFHFGGYAKHPPALLAYMNKVWEKYDLPLDIVYTGKAFYALEQLIEKNYFPTNSRLLFIHSGGLQGNRSLPPHTLQF